MEVTNLTSRSKARRQNRQGFEIGDAREPRKKTHLKSLLVPTDFSETALKALEYAISLAKQYGATINLIHVAEPPWILEGKTASFPDWDNKVMQQAKDRLNEIVQNRIDELITATTDVEIGRPYKKICDVAKEQISDLIVIGTHGLTGLRHLLMGSTAERVVRHAPCSVLVVRGFDSPNVRAEFCPKKILVPTDFSTFSDKALNWAIDLAREHKAEIYLLYVVPVYYPAVPEMALDIGNLQGELQKSGEKRLARLVKKSSKEIPIQPQIKNGRAATQIIEAVKNIQCDLVIIATHGLTGWNRVFLGGTTEEVVKHAPCPVLVFR